MRKALFIGWLIIGLNALAQDSVDNQVLQEIDSTVALITKGDYIGADQALRAIMSKMEALPSDMAYYFGRNSYHLEKYKQSINWLNKYIQLKGTQGKFYQEANKYLQLAEDQFLQISRKEPIDLTTELSGEDYDCGGLKKMICPVCHGDGVIIKKGKFDNIYQTCPYSQGESYLSCEDYNLFMRGLLDPPGDKKP
ncbi:hypothetical protein [Marinoscillum sp. MHG1-6]|uniref:hypothetical protein n=1 Tax=Marinoscillum sp. MHG1-6 TaxID=2959627 RepID=UPI002157AB7C|nr:hypothetical protein [Marinoscillum sp. MHG1-6]